MLIYGDKKYYLGDLFNMENSEAHQRMSMKEKRKKILIIEDAISIYRE